MAEARLLWVRRGGSAAGGGRLHGGRGGAHGLRVLGAWEEAARLGFARGGGSGNRAGVRKPQLGFGKLEWIGLGSS
jgi:hypothetical protein